MAQIRFKDHKLPLLGTELKVGDLAPSVELRGKALRPIKIGGADSKCQIIMSLPSLDTPVCAKQAHESNERLASFKNVSTFIVSMDLPFAMQRFCSTKGIENLHIASDFVAKEFGHKYGVLIGKSVFEGLLARAIFVIKDGVIVYKQLVPDLMQAPNLADLESFMRQRFGVEPRLVKRL